MLLTVTLNPAIDKMVILNNFDIHQLHRLKPGEKSMTLPGGKGVNIALSLGLMGHDVVAAGFAAGYTGHLLTHMLRSKGITTNFIFSEGNTRTNISILDVKKETLTEINEEGPEVSEEDQEYFIRNYRRILHNTEMVVLGGSLPKGVKYDFYARLVKYANDLNVPVVAHVSSKYFDAILSEKPLALIPDLRSKQVFKGKPMHVIQALYDLGKDMLSANKYLKYVIFENKIENVVALNRDMAFVLRPRNLKIVNMLGYADAYVSGFVNGMVQKDSFLDSLKFASACGLTNVEQLCKDLHTMDNVYKNINRIEVEELL